jgi:hypothetical protein
MRQVQTEGSDKETSGANHIKLEFLLRQGTELDSACHSWIHLNYLATFESSKNSTGIFGGSGSSDGSAFSGN